MLIFLEITKPMIKQFLYYCFAVLLFCNCKPETESSATQVAISVSYPDDLNVSELDGRLLLILADSDEKEPRFQVTYNLNAQPVFGKNVDGLAPNQNVVFIESSI